MEQKKAYVLASAGDVGRLEDRVGELIRQGYELYGTLSTVWDPVRHCIMLYQPMVIGAGHGLENFFTIQQASITNVE